MNLLLRNFIYLMQMFLIGRFRRPFFIDIIFGKIFGGVYYF